MIAVLGVLVLVVVLVVVLAGVAIFFISRSGSKKNLFQMSEEKLSEWTQKSSTYDSGKGREDRVTDRETLEDVREICRDVKSRIRSGLSTPVKLGSQDEVSRFDPQQYLSETSDRDELDELIKASDDRIHVFLDSKSDLDMACVMAHDSMDRTCRELCEESIDEVYQLLSPDPSFECSCNTGAGRKFSLTKKLPRKILLRMAGRPAEDNQKPDDDIALRRRELARVAYRCERCGKSPLTGANLILCHDFDRYEVLCDHCTRNVRTGV